MVATATTTRRFTTQLPSSTLKVTIIGSGPSGFYTAKYIQSLIPPSTSLSISIIDQLPVPYGLVRSGVAPDHPEVKNVENDFAKIITTSDSINFFGNVLVQENDASPSASPSISLADLQSVSDCVVLAYGASGDRTLSLNSNSSQNIPNVISARKFVHWYNGYTLPPTDAAELAFLDLDLDLDLDEKIENVVIIGQGNVALDCGRVMVKVSERGRRAYEPLLN